MIDVRKYKKTLYSLGAILALAAVLLIGGNIILGKIADLREQKTQIDHKVLVLTQKLEILKNFQLLGNVGQKVLIALPKENSSISAVSQVKAKASSQGVAVASFESNTVVSKEGEPSYVDLDFNIKGNLVDVFGFLNSLSQVAPLSKIQKVELDQEGESSTLRLTYRTFFEDLPTTITKVEDPIRDLDQSDREVLNKLIALETPPIVEVAPTAPQVRENPFGI